MEIAQAIAPESMGSTITAGEILVEIMATSIGEGFAEPLSLVGPFASGAPAIFIDQVARMGCGAGIISAVGRDDFGHLNVDRLKRPDLFAQRVAGKTQAERSRKEVRHDGEDGRAPGHQFIAPSFGASRNPA